MDRGKKTPLISVIIPHYGGEKILQECSLDIKIYNNRIESYFKDNIEVIVSRAFASLKKLLNSIYHLITQETVLVVHKGKKHIQEIEEAKILFAF